MFREKAISRLLGPQARRLFAYLRPYGKLFSLAILCMVLFGASDGVVPFLLKDMLDGVFAKQDPSLLYLLPPILIGFSLLRAVFDFGQQYFMSKVGHLVIQDLRRDLSQSLLNQGTDYYITHPAGDLIAHFTSDVLLVRTILVESVAAVMRDVVRIAALLVAAFFLDPALALIACVVFPVGILPIHHFGKKLRKLSKRGQDSIGTLTSVLQEMLVGNRVIRLFAREQYEQARFQQQNILLTNTFVKSEKIRALTGPINECLATLAISGVLLYGGYTVLQGQRSQGEFIAFLLSLFLLYDPFKGLGRVHSSIQQGMAGAERIFSVLDARPTVQDPREPTPLLEVGELEFRNVCYTYPGKDCPVLNGVSLKVPSGTRCAFVGASGSGKSTLVDLVPRLLDPQGGAVLLNNIDIRNFKLADLRSKIAVVSQHTFLFHDTILNNIRYGRLDASLEEVEAAAQAAFATEFIRRIPKGFEHVVGEGGYALSGGERQRIAIARAILKNAPILILDEATASLDNQSEREVQAALDALVAEQGKGKTVLMIAHRLSTIRNADTIAVLREGTLVETGKHNQLLKLGAEYARLHDLQFSK